jgi:RNA methyltransferase, TrmH family
MDLSKLVPAGIHNPRIKQYMSIQNNTKSNTENLLCLEGLWALSMALKSDLEFRAFFICPELLRGDAGREFAQKLIDTGVHSYVVSDKVMRRIVERDEPDGLAAIAQLPNYGWNNIELKENNILLVLDGLEITGNIGTIIRCADGVGANGIIITNNRTRLSHPKILRSSMGSLFTLPVIKSDTYEAIEWLKSNDFSIITADTSSSISYKKANYQGRIAIVLGSERYGIAKDWHEAQDLSVSIPMSGSVDSLNVGNAAALLLYEALYQQEPSIF